ncbi:MAG: SH3 domain-containing protein [Anaerolineae bacterium]|nr:SH3 domain-containing protein [Anaerolineae bacterium]
MHSRTRFVRILLAGVVLLMAALACNLEIGGDGTAQDDVDLPDMERPVVEILDLENGATFTIDELISVHARATSASGVTLVELLVNGVTVDSQPPAESLNPTTLDAVLDYQPERSGTFTLAVRAYSNTVVGQPEQRTITVLPNLDAGSGGSAGTLTIVPLTSTPNPLCRARTNTNLNFRTGPSTKYTVIRTLPAGQEVPITGYAPGPDGDGQWWQAQVGGQLGWLYANYTTQLGNCVAVPVASYPALPTPTPTNTPLPGATATPTLPDLRLSKLEGVTSVTLNDRGQAQADYLIEVVNQGGTASGQFRLAILTPTGEVVLENVPSLNAGQAYQIRNGSFTVMFNNPGLSRILVTVDDNNMVAEGNEGNNQAYRDINVQYGPATITPVAQPTNTPIPQPTNTPIPQPTDTPIPQPTDTAIPQPTSTPLPTATPVEQVAVPFSAITSANASAVEQIEALTAHGGSVTAVDFNATGTILASGSRDGTVRLWDTYTSTELATLVHDDRISAIVFSPNSAQIATVTQGGTVRLWDAGSGVEIATFTNNAEAGALAFSPDGSRIAVGGMNSDAQGGLVGMARVWDIASAGEVFAMPMFGPVVGLGFLDNDTLVIGSQGQSCDLGGGGVEIFSVSGGVSLGTYPDTAWVNALTVDTSTGQVAASGQQSTCGGNGVVWVWSAGTLRTTLDHGSSTSITDIAFNATGSLIATSSGDGMVRLWNLDTSAQVAVLTGHDSALGVAFKPDDTLIASGGGDSTLRLWGVQ